MHCFTACLQEGGAHRHKDEAYQAAENLLGAEVMTIVRKIRTLQVRPGPRRRRRGLCVLQMLAAACYLLATPPPAVPAPPRRPPRVDLWLHAACCARCARPVAAQGRRDGRQAGGQQDAQVPGHSGGQVSGGAPIVSGAFSCANGRPLDGLRHLRRLLRAESLWPAKACGAAPERSTCCPPPLLGAGSWRCRAPTWSCGRACGSL